MKSLWSDKDAKPFLNDPLALRVYTSRLLGKETSLVLHGGGNTSVKVRQNDFFGQPVDVLHIKGSGWDLATIEAAGFAPVRLDVLKRMAQMTTLSDIDMVREQRAAMLNPNAPNPSVEAILHAIIPFNYVDHSHTDALVAITNTPNGHDKIKEIYHDRVLIVPYVMPGFVLARRVYEMTNDLDWTKYDGIVLLNHGLFTFANDAKKSYEQHIRLVSKAENYIKSKRIKFALGKPAADKLIDLAHMRQLVSKACGHALVAHRKNDALSVGFSNLSNVSTIATRGTLTPDHVIRTKPKPCVMSKDIKESLDDFIVKYKAYFNHHNKGSLKMLDPAPRWVIWPGQGIVTFGRSLGEAMVVSDIVDHTVSAIQWAEAMGGWKVISTKDIFEMEYWDLEQAKLSKVPKQQNLQGKVALVTGCASGIGKACVKELLAQGASVAAVDISKNIKGMFASANVLEIVCDLTKSKDVNEAVSKTVQHFGGLDIVVSNAGIFPPSENIKNLTEELWDKSMAINLTSHQRLMSAAIAYLEVGLDPTIIIVASKNVPAPGPGAAAYSAAKAGLTQLARVAALELGSKNIRVNVLHPNQVFDTAIWTKDVLEKRARHYGMSVDEYKTNNILKVEITSKDVAGLVCSLAGPAFHKTTGSQIPIDGGNERVI